jgi:alpha-1,3-rhamnosyltransferase
MLAEPKNSSLPNENLVSIICLAYNTGQRLYPTLNSIINQTYKNRELIIVDDGSADDTVELIDDWLLQNKQDARFIKNKENHGIGKSVNTAIQYCNGKYLCLIGDDEWDPAFIEELVAVIEKAPENVAMVYSKARIFDKTSNCLTGDILDPMQNMKQLEYKRYNQLFRKLGSAEKYFLSSEYMTDALFWTNPVISFCVLIKLSALKKAGLFEEKYLMEDFPTWFRLASRFDFIFLDRCLATYNKYSSNTSDDQSDRLEAEVQQIRDLNKNRISFKDTRVQYITNKMRQILRTRKGRNKVIFISSHPALILLYFKRLYNKLLVF